MAAILHVYKEVEIINEGMVRGTIQEPGLVTVSYDEKPGIQALATTTPDRPPVPGKHASHLRDYEYKRLGTVSLLAGSDLHTGKVIEVVRDTHASRDFIALLQKLDESYPAGIQLRVLLDNHSAHISKETQRYLASRPQRFSFVFLPKHGSWLNLIETLFSKMTRSMLRGDPRRHQARIDRPDPSVLRRGQCGPCCIPLEVQDGRNYHCLVTNRTMI